jgi:hypothetical protein
MASAAVAATLPVNRKTQEGESIKKRQYCTEWAQQTAPGSFDKEYRNKKRDQYRCLEGIHPDKPSACEQLPHDMRYRAFDGAGGTKSANEQAAVGSKKERD